MLGLELPPAVVASAVREAPPRPVSTTARRCGGAGSGAGCVNDRRSVTPPWCRLSRRGLSVLRHTVTSMTSVSATRKAARPTTLPRVRLEHGEMAGRCGSARPGVGGRGCRRRARTVATAPARPALRIGEVDVARAGVVPTGLSELDRVLGGGLVPGGVVPSRASPASASRRSLLEVAARTARSGRPALYVTGEESAAQVRLRAERIEAMAADPTSPPRPTSRRCSGTSRRWSRSSS